MVKLGDVVRWYLMGLFGGLGLWTVWIIKHWVCGA